MLIRHKKSSDVASHEITPEGVYLNRRGFIEKSGLIAGSLVAGLATRPSRAAEPPKGGDGAFADVKQGYRKLGAQDPLTPYNVAASYNNFYEFGTDKADPAQYAGSLKPTPWTVTVDGL